jgi:hypothetical protein
MVQIVRGPGPVRINVTGPKQGTLGSILEPLGQGFSAGLGQGLSESFDDYFHEQKEKKYNSVIEKELAKYAEEEGEGEPTPMQMLRVAQDRKIDLRDSDREKLTQQAQAMAILQKNQQLEQKVAERQGPSPEQEERALMTLRELDPTSATPADAYNALRRNAGLSVREAKPFVDMFVDQKKSAKEDFEGGLSDLDSLIKDATNRYGKSTRTGQKEIKNEIDQLIAQRNKYKDQWKNQYRQKNAPGATPIQRGINFGVQSAQAPPQVSQGPTGPSTNRDEFVNNLFAGG